MASVQKYLDNAEIIRIAESLYKLFTVNQLKILLKHPYSDTSLSINIKAYTAYHQIKPKIMHTVLIQLMKDGKIRKFYHIINNQTRQHIIDIPCNSRNQFTFKYCWIGFPKHVINMWKNMIMLGHFENKYFTIEPSYFLTDDVFRKLQNKALTINWKKRMKKLHSQKNKK